MSLHMSPATNVQRKGLHSKHRSSPCILQVVMYPYQSAAVLLSSLTTLAQSTDRSDVVLCRYIYILLRFSSQYTRSRTRQMMTISHLFRGCSYEPGRDESCHEMSFLTIKDML